MNERSRRGPIPRILFALLLWLGAAAVAAAQTTAPAPHSPSAPASAATPEAPATSVAPAAPVPVPPPSQGKPLAPGGTPHTDEIEPNATPAKPGTATTETIDVPARPIVFVAGKSSYDDAFKSIKASLATVKAAMEKAGLKPTGHALTIFTDTDEKGFSYQSAIPIAAAPDKKDFGNGVVAGQSPAGSGLKFVHRGPFDEIDSTYDLIVAYLDEKGLQIQPPYIEEYLSDPTTPDDPNLEVDIYILLKK